MPVVALHCAALKEETAKTQPPSYQRASRQSQSPRSPANSLPPRSQRLANALGNRSFSNFVEDPSNLHKLFLTRRTLQLLSQRPDFQRLVKACFVRVRFAGGHRVAQIQGFGKWRPSTEPTLILRIDNNPRVFALEQLANSYYERAELLEWEYMWQAYNFELPTKRIVDQKYKALTDAKLQSQSPTQSQLRLPLAVGVHKPAKLKGCQLGDYQPLYVPVKRQKELPHVAAAGAGAPGTPPAQTSAAARGKYLVEPMECYRRYLPKTPPSAGGGGHQLKPALELPKQTTVGCAKKKISLDEYRERLIKKQQ
ncbi:uncharacterized protein Dvir_GJ15563 [Drosophila virilis]|uniref:Plus3 domain-containing protein n=1 Tax=Drosophila virilis TaxID=7244 RepID=B4MB11_DROVI|nr:uncharacterized protein Dvir_GJ15563 [Drosophila virilis]